ncbi:MAG: type VI secretion system contractile sheath large subunit [Lentisphaerae bacterium]|nr:type VI secretion system contractile sheath large subunit [Lentisphaerota bacterium]MCP4100899.1 type VI secretion system contractile sheath large subunit [Lentisphaerota bacterium]
MLQVIEKTEKIFERLVSSINVDQRITSDSEFNSDSFASSNLFSLEDDTASYYGLLLLLTNLDSRCQVERGFSKDLTQRIIDRIDLVINTQLNEIIKNPIFREMEACWLGIKDLVDNTDFENNVKIDLLDVSKDELMLDFDCSSVDITSAELFKKVYYAEYDQFGGNPYAAILGLYEFENTPEDIDFLSTVGKIATACHSPFISSISASFFRLKDIKDIQETRDIEGLMRHPRYKKWNRLRNTEQAAYIGLTLPRYIVREPWAPDTYPAGENARSFREKVNPLDKSHYVWSFASLLLARNLTRSFETSGWCQYIRGPRGGGLLKGLPTHIFNIRGREEIKAPVECIISDSKELALAKAGLIPLIYEKNSTNACFFSVQSLKQSKIYKDNDDTKRSQMISNLAYTFSVSRIAHYIKEVGRLNIGANSNAAYVTKALNEWINQYVTEVSSPSSGTLAYYPFKKAHVSLEAAEGQAGWYRCKFSVLPHLQFEGISVSLSLETKLSVPA